jgi:hypothetical protein
MAYVCVTKAENGFCAFKRLLRFFAKGKLYDILEEGDQYYLLTLDNKKVKLRGFTINVDLVVVVSETEPIEGWTCKSVEEVS